MARFNIPSTGRWTWKMAEDDPENVMTVQVGFFPWKI
jgi:hypothetical protein